MSEFFARMLTIDVNSLCLILLICGWGFMILRSMVPIAGLAVAAFPVLVFGALMAHALLFDAPFVARLEKGPGLALTTGIGMIAALIAIAVLVRLAMYVKDSVGRRPELLRANETV